MVQIKIHNPDTWTWLDYKAHRWWVYDAWKWLIKVDVMIQKEIDFKYYDHIDWLRECW